MLRLLTMRLFTGTIALLTMLTVPAAARAQSNADIQAGKTIFSGLCVTCHGFDGTGGNGPPLDRPKLLLAPTEAALRNIIAEGK